MTERPVLPRHIVAGLALPHRPGELYDEELPAVRKVDRPDCWNMFFRQMHAMPDGWRWVSVDCSPETCPDGYGKITGAVYPERKDKSTWKLRDKATEQSFFFKMQDLRDFEAACAVAMCCCPRCWGEGRTRVLMSVDKSQNTYRVCVACGGTGMPDRELEAALRHVRVAIIHPACTGSSITRQGNYIGK